ncbi:MAG: L-rhamnose isomerase, partial [Oscillospiraceae bacterium]|nr:L-rhamnose isomerase [Oscillospiraceae bacterium]
MAGSNRYDEAKKIYAEVGVDTDSAIETLSKVCISLHCWQGDDVRGFDTKEALSGGIQATGDYPGRASSPAELMQDIDKALSLIPSKHRLNLHACYAVFGEGEFADRDALEPRHFKAWADFAKARGLGIDFNPTFFSHPKANGLTLSSPDEEIRGL